jgi:hypothetical protein
MPEVSPSLGVRTTETEPEFSPKQWNAAKNDEVTEMCLLVGANRMLLAVILHFLVGCPADRK